MYRRIVTHTDFDGLVSALLLRDILKVEAVDFAEPGVIQKHEYPIEPGDVIIDLPYDERCALWIDHHASNQEEADELRKTVPEKVIFDAAKKSCPSLLYEHYHKEHPFLDEPEIQALIAAADKIDSASFTKEDIENPDVYGRISLTLKTDDSRKDDEFRRMLLNLLSFMSPVKVLEQPIVKKRVEKKLLDHEEWKGKLHEFARDDKEHGVVIVDFSDYDGDTVGVPRFLVYGLYPEAKIAITIYQDSKFPGLLKVGAGKNIFAEKCDADIGAFMKAHGGGGHAAAAGCTIKREEKEEFLKKLIAALSE